MAVQTLTIHPTEADLEARIHGALRAAFPWLNAESLRHQTKFAFKFGHKLIKIDGTTASAPQARADILVFHNDEPLAVLELKRTAMALSPDDIEQGLSYARMIHPRPPLVVVTNGTQLTILETHSGCAWTPETPSEVAVNKLIESAATIAASDLKRAVEVLMGPGSRVWMNAIRAATDATLSDMTGRWEEFEKPFVDGFLIPREATHEALAEISTGKRITIIEGPPLAGKSNVLRELALNQVEDEEMAVLFVEADSHNGGIVAMIAAILENALGWKVSVEDTRSWLARLSRLDGPALVLAIDGIGAARDEIRKDIEELTGGQYGENIKLVVTLDDAVTSSLIRNETGRKATNIGRRSAIVKLGTLTTPEFKQATTLLSKRRIEIMPGAQSAIEFRVPWILRSLAADVMTDPQHADDTLQAVLPPLLGTEVLSRSRERFDDDIRHSYRALAEAVMKDTADPERLPATVLQSMETFIIRRKTIKAFLDSHELTALINKGYAKETINADQDTVVIARLPELLASEMAILLAQDLKPRMSDPRNAASWFIKRCAHLALGDIVGAQALFDLVEIGGVIPFDFIRQMLSEAPRVETLKPGMKLAMSMDDGEQVKLTVRKDGRVLAQAGDNQTILDADDFESSLYASMDSWMILAHLAAHPFVVESEDGKQLRRCDPTFLTEVGTARMALRRPVHQEDIGGVLMHNLDGHGSIVCHDAGIVEPITWSIYLLLLREGAQMEDWLDTAVQRNSLPLLARIDLALRTLSNCGDKQIASWANRMLTEKIRPALKTLPALH